jgi:glycosyltransferase involved in cell wall biosynthesis
MRIVLDLQGAQSNSRYRGIGRYSLSMAKAFAAEAGEHELWLMLNGRYDDASFDLINQFEGLIPRERIVVDELPHGIAGCQHGNDRRVGMAEAGQSALLASLRADCIWHSSLFEGWGDDSAVTLGTGRDDARHAATLYDLIPLLHPGRHLRDADYRQWYYRRLALLKRCGLLLALSESSRREAIDALQIPGDRIAVVSGAADPLFHPVSIDAACRTRWRQTWGLAGDFLLYVGGYDAHKNVDALIGAYADLPAELHRRYPLVLAGRCDELARNHLLGLGRRHRLPHGALIFTGALADTDLTALYSGCTLFVAPSLHEGLGLPLLEAMACGAAVIGSDAASLPEVIGCKDALFDPRSRSSMTAKLRDVLTLPGLLDHLRGHAAVQARKFTWEDSARRARVAIEQHYRAMTGVAVTRRARPRLAYVSPLPPVRSGIADYSARLLRELDTHYEIDVVVDQPEVLDPWVQANFPLRTVDWLRQVTGLERVLYHFGNSPFHAHMFGLLEQRPGVVMLHDSWLGAVRNWMAQQSSEPDVFPRLLHASHGYPALLHDQQHGRASTLDAWPVSRDVIEHALGLVVHSDYAVKQARRYFGEGIARKFAVVPFPKNVVQGRRRLARRLLGFAPDDFMVCSFGMIAPTKLNHRLLAAWLQSPLFANPRCHLVFVGERHGGDYGRQMDATIRSSGARGRIHITDFVGSESYADYLAAADVAVQLRAASRGETSAAIFDVLAHGLPLVANAHGSAAELPPDVALMLPDRFEDAELADALRQLHGDVVRREMLGAGAQRWIREHHHPAKVALCYRDAIECFVGGTREAEQARMMDRMRRMGMAAHSEGDCGDGDGPCLPVNRARVGLPRLFVDVSATSRSDLHTGIERVVRGTLSELLRLDQAVRRVEPVRLESGCYRQAADYGLKVLGLPALNLADTVVQPGMGDILLGLDWVADALPQETALLKAWQVRGARLFFVVYDLLPVRMPRHFPEGIADMHARWLACIGQHADGLLCISRSVADDVRRWFNEHPPHRRRELAIGYFHPGNDPASTRPSTGLPDNAEVLLSRWHAAPTFLMVGTIEPRKGHAMALDAFERLWEQGVDVALVIVGREGWMCDTLAARLRSHAQLGRRLFWLDQASDEYLERIYDVARALVAASEGEGFGLPLVEAARRGLPVIARDIPVFREVSSGFASFFDGTDVDSLVEAIRRAARTERASTKAAPNAGPSWEATTHTLWSMLDDDRHPHWLTPWVRTGCGEFVTGNTSPAQEL